ncbi:MAG: hypothetical protein V3V35_10340, partial [Dehalococcoidia bacterium]
SAAQPHEPPAPDEVLGTLGLFRPVPIWEAAKAIQRMRPAQDLEVLSITSTVRKAGAQAAMMPRWPLTRACRHAWPCSPAR